MRFRLRPPTPFVFFVLLFLMGCTAVTLQFRHAQAKSMNAGPTTAPSLEQDLTESQKQYLDSRAAASERLFSLAFASLGALLGLRFSEKTKVHVEGYGPFAAGSLLLISLYSAFLFQIGASHVMEGPLNEIYGPVLSSPIVCQFWSLFGAVLLLAISLFKPSRESKILALAAGWSLLGMLPAQASDASTSYGQCARAWAASRSVELLEETIQDATTLSAGVAQRRLLEVEGTDRCELTAALLDEIRFTAISEGGAATGQPAGLVLAPLVRQVLKALENPTFAPGDLLDRVLSVAQVWREPSAILEIQGNARSLLVTILDPKQPNKPRRGYTRWIVRLPPGSYEYRVSDGGRQLERRTIRVRDGERLSFTVGSP